MLESSTTMDDEQRSTDNGRMTIRLAHFSDIHVTALKLGWRPADFLNKRLTGWANQRIGRGRSFQKAEMRVQRMMIDIRARGCDHLVFSGDATVMGFEAETRVAAGSLDFSLPGLAVPGNHDYYVRRAAGSGDFEQVFRSWQQGERVGDHVYPFAQRVGHCWLIGVNSARSNLLFWDARGGIGDDQAERLRQLLPRLSPGPRILVTHYPLYLADRTPEHRWRLLRDWRLLRQIAIEQRVGLWLHGHRHTNYVLEPLPDHPFPIICAGSATQDGRAGWNEYVIDGHDVEMTRHVWQADRYVPGDVSTIVIPG
jgi:3',5'-cyclic AMP phosphodiesterase CpdA